MFQVLSNVLIVFMLVAYGFKNLYTIFKKSFNLKT